MKMELLLHALLANNLLGLCVLRVSVLLALAWGMQALLRRSDPRWRVLVWRLACVGVPALMAASLLKPWMAIPVEVDVARKEIASEVAQAGTDYSQMESTIADRGQNATVTTNRNLPAAEPITWQLPSAASSIAEGETPWRALVLFVWLAGFLWFGLTQLRADRALNRLLTKAAPASEQTLALMREVGTRLELRRLPRLIAGESIRAPFLTGVFRPVLGLPAGMTEGELRGELPAVLAHELAHLRSGDLFWSRAVAVVRGLLWWHPLAWRMPAAHETACEQVSDAVSAGYLGDVNAYSRTLARIALELSGELRGSDRLTYATVIPMARSNNVLTRLDFLKRRFFAERLARGRVMAFVAAAAVCMIVLGCIGFARAEELQEAGKSKKRIQGWMDGSGKIIAAGHESKRTNGHGIFGNVVDAVTGEAVADFKVQFGVADEDDPGISWDTVNFWKGGHGEYAMPFDSGRVAVRILAPGYQAVTSELLDLSNGGHRFDARLEKNIVPRGRVVDALGEPVSGAEVAVYQHPAYFMLLKNGRIINREKALAVEDTDSTGQFELSASDPGKSTGIVAVHDRGYCFMRLDEFLKTHQMQLSPWARLEGTIQGNLDYNLKHITAIEFWEDSLLQDIPGFTGSFELEPDTQGHFVIDRVLPGLAFGFGGVIDLKAGETTIINSGNEGRPIKGSIKLSPMIAAKGMKQTMACIRSSESFYPPLPKDLAKSEDSKKIRQWQSEQRKSPEGRARWLVWRNSVIKVDEQGNFTGENIMPGTYDLTADYEIEDRPSHDPSIDPRLTIRAKITVPQAAENSREPYDFGLIETRNDYREKD